MGGGAVATGTELVFPPEPPLSGRDACVGEGVGLGVGLAVGVGDGIGVGVDVAVAELAASASWLVRGDVPASRL